METVLTAQNFESEVLRAEIPVLVDFWADWCGPCHAIAPAIAEIAKQYQGKLKVGKLNVDEYPQVAETYRVSSIPNLKIFKKGQIVEELVGAMPKAQIENRLKKHL